MKTRTNLKSSSGPHLRHSRFCSRRSPVAFASPAARASTERPFHADFITSSRLSWSSRFSTSQSMGRDRQRTWVRPERLPTIRLLTANGSGSATYTLTAANGDTLILALVVQPGGNINVAGGVIFSGDYTVTGGTGRFSGAMGGGIFAGAALFLDETDGIGCCRRWHHLELTKPALQIVVYDQ